MRSLGPLFCEMQKLVDKSDSTVISYFFSQCTLEQVIINLIRDEGNNDSLAS